MTVIFQKVEQIDNKCNVIMDYGESLSNSEIDNIISRLDLYKRTGIQSINFNTIYQLFCDKKSGKLDKASHFLMIPEYLMYKLTGVKKKEFTNATTAGLINADTLKFDNYIFDKLGLPEALISEEITLSR